MKRPDPKNYKPTDFIRGVYEDDLEKYIDYLEQNQAQLQQHGVMQAEGSDGADGAAVGKERMAWGECSWCEPANGFYLGTTCPKCQRPFRQEKRA